MTISDSVTELDELLLLETEGETALALSVKHHRPVVVYDLCASDTVVLAAAATNAPAATDKAVHHFQQQGKKVLRIADYPGLLVWRTVAMLANEALDAVVVEALHRESPSGGPAGLRRPFFLHGNRAHRITDGYSGSEVRGGL